MVDPFLIIIIRAALGGIITGTAAWWAIRVHIAWLRADIDRAHTRLDKIEKSGVLEWHEKNQI